MDEEQLASVLRSSSIDELPPDPMGCKRLDACSLSAQSVDYLQRAVEDIMSTKSNPRARNGAGTPKRVTWGNPIRCVLETEPPAGAVPPPQAAIPQGSISDGTDTDSSDDSSTSDDSSSDSE
eukprot:TRINITY_DN2506_c0_g1_i1.p2 TRINITY_DN2506_c0_g1~~TRINITY_DN2506_c0_g1_i1.p2  ORF type:complete len:122 (-),score=30.37 TRINITY_DN2506_c0_g1_i1:340-705(-)